MPWRSPAARYTDTYRRYSSATASIAAGRVPRPVNIARTGSHQIERPIAKPSKPSTAPRRRTIGRRPRDPRLGRERCTDRPPRPPPFAVFRPLEPFDLPDVAGDPAPRAPRTPGPPDPGRVSVSNRTRSPPWSGRGGTRSSNINGREVASQWVDSSSSEARCARPRRDRRTGGSGQHLRPVRLVTSSRSRQSGCSNGNSFSPLASTGTPSGRVPRVPRGARPHRMSRRPARPLRRGTHRLGRSPQQPLPDLPFRLTRSTAVLVGRAAADPEEGCHQRVTVVEGKDERAHGRMVRRPPGSPGRQVGEVTPSRHTSHPAAFDAAPRLCQTRRMAKIAIIGAGSVEFTRNILDRPLLRAGAARHARRSRSTTSTRSGSHTPRRPRTRWSRGIERRLHVVSAHADRKEAFEGADYLVNEIQVGGYKATVTDFEIPRRYGLLQTIADTIGMGGIMRGLRTIPVMIEMGNEMAELCPDGLLLNYTNPMAMVPWGIWAGSQWPAANGRSACATASATPIRSWPRRSASRSRTSSSGQPGSTTSASCTCSATRDRRGPLPAPARDRRGRPRGARSACAGRDLPAVRLLPHRVERALERVRAVVAAPPRPGREVPQRDRRVHPPQRREPRGMGGSEGAARRRRGDRARRNNELASQFITALETGRPTSCTATSGTKA